MSIHAELLTNLFPESIGSMKRNIGVNNEVIEYVGSYYRASLWDWGGWGYDFNALIPELGNSSSLIRVEQIEGIFGFSKEYEPFKERIVKMKDEFIQFVEKYSGFEANNQYYSEKELLEHNKKSPFVVSLPQNTRGWD